MSSSPRTSPSGLVSLHSRREDLTALLTGSLLVSLGLVLFRQAGLLSGGTAGIAFLLHYASGWPFGFWFFAINLPFYWLAFRRMGPAFTAKTFAAVGGVSLLAEGVPGWLQIAHLAPAYAAIAGGMLIGCGLLIFFRHGASLGGLNVVALALQESGRISAGRFQMVVDSLIVLAALWVADLPRVAWSVLGALAVNLVLADNHRPGRYRGMS